MFEFSRNVHCSIAKTVILLMIIHVIINCQIEQRHFLYLSNRTVNALYLWFMIFQPSMVWLTYWKFYIYGIVNILKVKQCIKFCISISTDFFFHMTWLNNKNILFIIKQCLDRWILKVWLTDWAQGKSWRVATLSSDLIQDSSVYICSEVVDSSWKIWILEIKVVT